MSPRHDIAIIGAGAIGQALAVDLFRRGYSIGALVECSTHQVNDLREAAAIKLTGHIGEARMPLPRLGTQAAAAVGSQVLLIATTVDAHQTVATALAPVLTDAHIILLANGYVNGSRRFATALKAAGCSANPSVLELNTTPFLVCSPCPGHVHVTAQKSWMELSSHQPGLAQKHHRMLAGIVPGIEVCDNALASSLNNQNPIAHVPSYLMNASRAIGSQPVLPSATRGGAFYLEDYSSEAVLRLRAAADAERMAVMRALGLDAYAIPRPVFSQRCYGPGARETVSPRIGRTFPRRFVIEDVPYGLLPIEALGRQTGVDTSVISSMITLIGALESYDWREHFSGSV